MSNHDPFRDFLELLTKEKQLLRIEEEVDPHYELSAFCRHVADDDGPALLFANIKGYRYPALANMFGTRKRIAMALGVPEEMMAAEIAERLKQRIPPEVIASQDARCHEVVLEGDDIDLTAIPAPFWNVGDGGNYITAGLNIGQHPSWGRNAGIYRNMIRNKREIFAQIAPDHQQRLFYEDIGAGCPMAIALGVDPLLYLAAGSDFALGDFEMEVAGALRGHPLRATQAKTIDVLVPADAEIVIETVYTGEKADEGPFNEFTGYQSEIRSAPIWRVTAITMRRDPIMQMAYAGKPPNENIVFWRELEDAVAQRAMNGRFPFVSAVARPAALARDFWGIIQINAKRMRPGGVRNAMLALTFLMPRLKFIVAVDDDIDIFNISDVFWAISTRVDPGRDTFTVSDTGAGPIDPSSYEFGIASKLFIDATKKAHFRGITSSPPSDVLERARERLDKILAERKSNEKKI